jgi:hypothetical protein
MSASEMRGRIRKKSGRIRKPRLDGAQRNQDTYEFSSYRCCLLASTSFAGHRGLLGQRAMLY